MEQTLGTAVRLPITSVPAEKFPHFATLHNCLGHPILLDYEALHCKPPGHTITQSALSWPGTRVDSLPLPMSTYHVSAFGLPARRSLYFLRQRPTTFRTALPQSQSMKSRMKNGATR